MRIALALATAFLLLGAAVARADPSFVLSPAAAGPGEVVHFTISGTEDRAVYTLEVGDQGVASGSVAADSDVSGEFTMPNLGGSNRAVTVEAEIRQPDETTTRARTLQYVAPAPATAPPPDLRPAPGPTSAPPQAVTASSPPQRARQRKRAPHPAPRKRPARRSHHARPARAQHRWRRHGARSSSLATGVSTASPAPASASHRAERPAPEARSPGGRHESAGRKGIGSVVPALFAVPPAPMLVTAASGVAGHGGAPPIAVLMVLALLGVSALTVADGRLARQGLPVRLGGRTNDRAAQDPVRFLRQPQQTELVDVVFKPLGRTIVPDVSAVPPEAAATWFRPIELAIVDERATLATRSERKYVLDEMTFSRLIRELRHHYLVLEIDGARVFPYDTVYFDTPTLTTYRQHLQDRRRRFKCRTRLYTTSDLCFFEVKLKGGRGETIKRRRELAVEDHGYITDDALAFLAHQLNETYSLAPPAALAPTLRTTYRRLTLVGHTNSERLTFDFELTVGAKGKRFWIEPGRVLLEAKGSGDGVMADDVLRRLGVRPVASCSKYCLGVALTHPEVTNNPFRPLIRRHFDASRNGLPRLRP